MNQKTIKYTVSREIGWHTYNFKLFGKNWSFSCKIDALSARNKNKSIQEISNNIFLDSLIDFTKCRNISIEPK